MTNTGIILQELKAHIADKYKESLSEVILFGSRATGQYQEFSDFDILILLDGDYNSEDENNILDLCYDIDLKYNILIDAHLISKKELSSLRGQQPVFLKAIKSGIYA
jgi:predicted nucleotidyltransferase